MQYIIFLFSNSHYAIQAELETKAKYGESGGRLIPLPPEVSAGCGMVLRVLPEDGQQVYRLLLDKSIEVEGIYDLTIDGKKRSVKKREPATLKN